jgi:hypothetical protein
VQHENPSGHALEDFDLCLGVPVADRPAEFRAVTEVRGGVDDEVSEPGVRACCAVDRLPGLGPGRDDVAVGEVELRVDAAMSIARTSSGLTR